MPLDQGQLKAELAAIYRGFPPSPAESARKMAKAYDAYAKAAEAGPGKPSFTGSEVKLLEATLLSAIASPRAGTPARIAQAWSQGVQAYWMAPPVQFTGGGVITGVTTAIPGAPSLVATLMAVYRNLGNTPDSAATQIAAALHAATMTTFVTYLMAGAPPFPLVATVS